MPRAARSAIRGFAYHVFNRGNDKRELFLQPGDYRQFLALMRDAPQAEDVGLLAYCLMPNHWHMVLMPLDVPALSAYLQWVSGTHGMRWRRDHDPDRPGHVYQGRFKSVPILTDQHLLTVLRYVEANPARARLAERARDWPWSSRSARPPLEAPSTAKWPWPVPANWERQLDTPQPPEQLDAVRQALIRGVPLEAIEAAPAVPPTVPAETQPDLF
jgi:putative transposase